MTEDGSDYDVKDSIFKRDDDFIGGDGEGDQSDQFAGFIRKKQQIFEMLNEKTTPNTIINLSITANVLFLTLLVVAGIEFFITDQEFQQVKNNVLAIYLLPTCILPLPGIGSYYFF